MFYWVSLDFVADVVVVVVVVDVVLQHYCMKKQAVDFDDNQGAKFANKSIKFNLILN